MRLLPNSLGVSALFVCVVAGLHGAAAFAMVPPSERAVLDAIYYGTGGIPPGGGSRTWINITGWGLPPFLGISECDSYGISCVVIQGEEHISGIMLDDNGLTGQLPPSLSDLPYLQTFSAADNDIGGSIPALSGLTELIDFNLEDNQLTGALPSLGGLAHLESFWVDRNQLTGAIPPLAGLASLRDFRVYDNHLTGQIPSLAGLQNLELFAVLENELTGPLPDLSNMTSLGYFSVDSNELVGEIPSLTGLSNLWWFSVSDNHLTGPLPDLSNLTSLSVLYVSSNELTGLIPAAPPNLQSAAICSNRFTISSQPAIDPAWQSATGTGGLPWWAVPFASNRCDELLYSDFEWPPST